MSGTIFDAIEEEPKKGYEGYFELAANAPKPKKKSFLNKAGEYGKSALKGGVEGLYQLGRIMGPTGLHQHKELTEELDRLLPTEEEGLGQRGLRRGLKEVPTALAFPGSKAITGGRALLGGVLAETAKELGAPEWAQALAEISAYVGPDVTKKLLESGKNKELIQIGRKLGLNDKQLTPLLQSETKQKFLTKLAPKRGSTQKALEESKSGLSKGYETLKNSESAVHPLGESAERKLQNELGKLLVEMPVSVRHKVQKDLTDLFSAPVTGKSLMNFYADVNASLGQGTKQLSILKRPITKAIYNSSPELGKDFEIVNKLYSEYSKISNRLKPTLASDILSAAETLGMVGAVFGLPLGHYISLVGIAGEQAARKISQQMLLNPHFQQLGKKMVVALNENKFNLAKKIIDDYSKYIKKIDPKTAAKIEEIPEEELEKFFKDLQGKT